MAYDIALADRVRHYLSQEKKLHITEKKMFGGLAFMVNDKMCINISRDRLMCRYNPDRREEVINQPGYEPMVMKNKNMKGYCYVSHEGIDSDQSLEYWIQLCLDFNDQAKSSKKK